MCELLWHFNATITLRHLFLKWIQIKLSCTIYMLKNGDKSGKKTHENLHIRTFDCTQRKKVWTYEFWTDDSLDMKALILKFWAHNLFWISWKSGHRLFWTQKERTKFLNIQNSGLIRFWIYNSLDMNAQIFKFWAHEIVLKSTKVWS